MQSMLHQLIAERASDKKRFEAEKDRRKRAEEAAKESGRKLALLEHTDRVAQRKLKEVGDGLRQAAEERDELRRMLSHQATQVHELEKQRDVLDKKLSAYDDDFYKLEARNMRDKVKMEELARAKAKADEERGMYKTMLQASHERGLRERQELRRDALQKLEAMSKEVSEYKEEIHRCKQKLFEQEQALKARLRLEEEMTMYKNMLLEERMARVELEQKMEASGVGLPPPSAAGNTPSSAGTGGAQGTSPAELAGGAVGASKKLMGGIRRLQRKNSWGRQASGTTPGSAASSEGGRPPSATAFLKGVTSGFSALANDLADAALGTDPAVAAAANASTSPSRTGRPPPLRGSHGSGSPALGQSSSPAPSSAAAESVQPATPPAATEPGCAGSGGGEASSEPASTIPAPPAPTGTGHALAEEEEDDEML